MTRPAWNWKAWLLTVVFVTAVVGVIVAKRIWVYRNIHEPLQRRAALISAELKTKGARVGEPEVLDDVRGAEQIVSLDIDGRKVRLLELDPSKSDEANELRRIHEQHTTRLFGTEQPAEDESAIVIVDFEQHPRKGEILESFHKTALSR